MFCEMYLRRTSVSGQNAGGGGVGRREYLRAWRSCSFSAKASRFIWSRRTRALMNIPIGGFLARRRRGVGNIVVLADGG